MRLLPIALSASVLLAWTEPGSGADLQAGNELAVGCASCHGEAGVSEVPLTPSLAGQPDEFVQWQLVYFRSGARKDEVMGPIAEALSNEEIRNLGAYYASLPPPKPTTPPDALSQTGEQLASQHRCRSCHADDLNGFRAAARLPGQRDFKSGKRVGSGVASMADATFELSDADMQALSRYLATRP
jgi:cytochrome c553